MDKIVSGIWEFTQMDLGKQKHTSHKPGNNFVNLQVTEKLVLF